MSWHYLQDAEAVSSEAISWDGERFAPLKSKTTLGEYCYSDNEMESCRASRYGTIFGRLTDDLGAGESISFPAGFRVRTFLAQEKARGLLANDPGSGPKWQESFARYDRDSRSWKTSQLSLDGDLIEFSGTWPTRGTMRGGVCWELMTPERPTTESEFGYLPTPTDSMVTIQDFNQAKFAGNDPCRPKYKDAKYYPTPYGLSANKGQGGGEFDKAIRYWPTSRAGCPGSRKTGTGGAVLGEMAKMWPSPRSTDGSHGGRVTPRKARNGGNLVEAVSKAMFPTPRANKRGLPDSHGNTDAYLPTPAARDYKSGQGADHGDHAPPLSSAVGGQLSPLFVEWLMDFPIGFSGLRPLGMHRFLLWLRSHSLFYPKA